MATEIDLNELRALLARGAQLVEVLPEKEYRQAHLPDAISLPLGKLKGEHVAGLDRERPIVVYCWDSL